MEQNETPIPTVADALAAVLLDLAGNGGQADLITIRPQRTGEVPYRLHRDGEKEWEGGLARAEHVTT